MITAEGICKKYGGKIVLDSVGLSVNSGESAVIVGRNGIGKSTLLSILAGFLRADSGVVRTEGMVAFCPQEDSLFDELTVRDNLKFWQAASGSHENLDWLVKLLGVDEFIGKRVKNLSIGMKKCAAICCAVCGDYSTIILDEPFAGLDIFHKNALLDGFNRMKSEGKAILYSSHSLDEIVGLDSAIYTLANGQLSKFSHDGSNVRESLLKRI